MSATTTLSDPRTRKSIGRPLGAKTIAMPTRPAKKKDPDAKKWGSRPAVELDAIPPDMLIALVERAILEHIDPHSWNVELAVEQEERDGLLSLAQAWEGGAA